MALSPEEIDVVRELRGKGYTSTQIKGFIAGERLGAKPSTVALAETRQTHETRFGDVGEDLATGAKQLWGDFKNIGNQVSGSVEAGANQQQSLPETGVQVASSIVGGGVGSIIGRGVQTLGKMFMKPSEETAVGDAVASGIQKTGLPQKFQELSPRTQRNVQAGSNLLELVGVKGAGSVASKGVKGAVEVAAQIGDEAADQLARVGRVGDAGIKSSVSLGISPEDLMQRVARVSKGKQAKFEERAGESIGSYLVNRKVFGGPDEITEQLYENMKMSKSRVDAGLSRVGGTYKDDVVTDALEQLAEREMRVSTKRTPSKDQYRVNELVKKHQTDGLSLSEVNEVKRLYERNVKVDYMRDNVSDKVAQATNIDEKLRQFVEDKAAQGGFKDVKALNRETTLAKQLLDDIGAEYAGQAGNNLVSLSDAFFLAEAASDPRALLAFGIKKTVGSKEAMSAVARYMSRNRQKREMPTGDVNGPLSLPERGATSAPEDPVTPLPARTQSTIDATERTNPAIKQPERGEPRPDIVTEQRNIQQGARDEVRANMTGIGSGIAQGKEANTYQTYGSLPSWIPKELRDTKLIDAVWKHIENDTVPKDMNGPTGELYAITQSEIAKRDFELSAQANGWLNNSGKPMTMDDIPFSYLIATGGTAAAYYLYDGESGMPMAAMVGLIAMSPAKKLKLVQRQIDDIDRMLDKNLASGMKTNDPNYKSLMEARKNLLAERSAIPD